MLLGRYSFKNSNLQIESFRAISEKFSGNCGDSFSQFSSCPSFMDKLTKLKLENLLFSSLRFLCAWSYSITDCCVWKYKVCCTDGPAQLCTLKLSGLIFASLYFPNGARYVPSLLICLTYYRYGELSPSTFPGKLIGGLCALCGIFILTLPIPIVVNRWKLDI